MSLARLAEARDLESLQRLASVADPRVYTLPRSRDELQQAIERSVDSAARRVDLPSDEQYLMVLENERGELEGVAALRATAGSQGTFFAYRNDVIHHASRDLKISNNVHVLTLSSDLTGHTQLMSFFVDSAAINRSKAALLSRARLLLAALEPGRFSQRFFASFAGWCDEQLASPFWDALGRQFFGMDFIEAERAVAGARNRTLIVELMPHYPVYVPLLPPAARSVIGQLHEHATLPFEVLSDDGFEGETYLDLFDGGPILEAHASKLRTIRGARTLRAELLGANEVASEPVLVARAGALRDVRCTWAPVALSLDEGVARLPAATLDQLRLSPGEAVMVVVE